MNNYKVTYETRKGSSIYSAAIVKAETTEQAVEWFNEYEGITGAMVDELREPVKPGQSVLTVPADYENRKHCQRIAEEIEHVVNGEALDEDGEPVSLFDYFNEAYDIAYTIGADKEYRSARIMVACGGPNIYIDTNTAQVELYRWSESAKYPLSYEARDAIDEVFEEYYHCL